MLIDLQSGQRATIDVGSVRTSVFAESLQVSDVTIANGQVTSGRAIVSPRRVDSDAAPVVIDLTTGDTTKFGAGAVATIG